MAIGLLARIVRIGGRFENDPLGILWHLFPKNPCRFVTVPKRNEPKRRSLGQEKGIRLLEEIDKTEAEEYEVLRESEQRREVRGKRGYERGHAAVLNPNPPPEAPPSSSSIRFSLHSALLLDFGCTNYPTPLGHNINSWLNPPSQRHPGPGLALWSSLTSASQMMRRNRPPHADGDSAERPSRQRQFGGIDVRVARFPGIDVPVAGFLRIDVPVATPTAIRRNRRSRGHTDGDSAESAFPWPHRRRFGGIDVPVATPTSIRGQKPSLTSIRRNVGHANAKVADTPASQRRHPHRRRSSAPRTTCTPARLRRQCGREGA